jgi:hypothetical protein
MNLSALASKIAEPQYRGLPDQLMADAVNGLRVSVRRPVPTWLVRQTAIEGGYWPSLIEARESTTPAIRALAITVLAWIDDQSGTIQSVDMDRAAVVAMRAAIVQAGLCSQDQADALRVEVEAVGGEAPRFLKLFGITTFEAMPADRLDEALAMLEAKRMKRAA